MIGAQRKSQFDERLIASDKLGLSFWEPSMIRWLSAEIPKVESLQLARVERLADFLIGPFSLQTECRWWPAPRQKSEDQRAVARLVPTD
ncbi:hypothetical protein AXW67_33215 [Bradyrhizobium neotropicale]|uniref:Uncharacterized protein n=1 Tax=Bradyrhizobium neotropicale TaxID=1497615 RepID=A0A176YI65_9BRAD|nr:hypothetical protein AXW67_33215 [Bradyrhizobium neotropicale]